MKNFPLLFLALVLIFFSGKGEKVQTSKDLTVSGLSAGGMMAAQMQVIYSGRIRASANFAGGVYYCAKDGGIWRAATSCLNQPDDIIVDEMVEMAKKLSKEQKIDDILNLRGKRAFAWTGANDFIVLPSVSKKWQTFMQKMGANFKGEYETDCTHALPTDDIGNEKNEFGAPFINNCGYKGVYEALKYLYHDVIIDSKEGFHYENIFKFSQNNYNPIEGCMHQTGYLYVPSKCQISKTCPLHVVFHGCLQTYDHIGLDMITKTHYAELAERNEIVMLFPMGVKSTKGIFNPRGCWDWWGYCDSDPLKYATNQGTQPQAIMKMVTDLQKGELEVERAREETFLFRMCENKPFWDTKVEYPMFPSDY